MKLPEGTIFRFTKPEARKPFLEGEWDQLCVVLLDGELGSCDGQYRRLTSNTSWTGCAVKDLPLEYIELVGLIPKNKMGATEWNESFGFPHGLVPGTVIQFNTKPKWWTCEDWSARMVVMFPNHPGLVRFRRMAVSIGSYHSQWNPTSNDFKIVGHLTPDQLDVTDSTVGLKPASEQPNEEKKEKQPAVVDPRFTPGVVFRLTGDSKPSWWVASLDSWNEPCVVIDWKRSQDGAVPFRLLAKSYPFDTMCFFPDSDADAFEIIGRLPEDKLDSTDDDDIAQNKQPAQPPEKLPVGTKFCFKVFPARWDSVMRGLTGSTEFEVVEHKGFNGEGQCIKIIGGNGGDWYSSINGVLPSDDIEIVKDLLPVDTRFRFTEIPDRWDYIPDWVSTNTEFEVIGHERFNGEGQGIISLENGKRVGHIYSHTDGVLFSDDIEIIKDDKPVQRLPIGTRLLFRSFPGRWDYTSGDSSTLFEVIEHEGFEGIGQCLRKIESDCTWYSHKCGVLPSDDIEIIGGKVENADWHGWEFTHAPFGFGWEAKKGDRRIRHKDFGAVLVDVIDAEGLSPSHFTGLENRIVELAKDNGELRAVSWKSTACDLEKRVKELEKENGLLKGSISAWQTDALGLSKRKSEINHAFMLVTGKSYDASHDYSNRPRKVLAFLKRIW